jgi:hypothetical protein
MKKLLGIVVLGLLLSGGASSEETICLYEDILNKKYPCANGPRLKKELENPFFDYLPRPSGVSVEQYRALINKRIKEWDDGAEQRGKEYDAQRKKEIDFRCEVLAGKANNWFSSRKIYKKCMRAEGY